MSEIVLKGIPTFRILDYRTAVEFYIQGLRFKVDWGHRFGPDEPVYVQISSNGLKLHLSENKRFATGVIVFVECRGLNRLYADWDVIKNNIEIAQTQENELANHTNGN